MTTVDQGTRKPPQTELDPEDKLLRASDVMRFLNVSRATAYRIMTEGSMRVYRLHANRGRRGMVRVSLRELMAWREAQRHQPESA